MITFDRIEKIICDGENILPCKLRETARYRDRELVFARQCIFYFAKKYTKLSLKVTGIPYGKDHATVLYACKAIQDLFDTDKFIRNKIMIYDAKIKQDADCTYNNVLLSIAICEKYITECISKHTRIDEKVIRIYNHSLV